MEELKMQNFDIEDPDEFANDSCIEAMEDVDETDLSE